MRREAFFSGDSPYELLVRSNLLLHAEVISRVAARVGSLLETRGVGGDVHVLDLACGVPLVMTEVMERFPERGFRYTGVDINPDQVERAREMSFPANVSASILEGSAWELSHLSERQSPEEPEVFDVVFVGLNWHHGTPEELWYLAVELRGLLMPEGLLINHDCYRPTGTAYLRRPRTVAGEEGAIRLDLVETELLAKAGVPDFRLAAVHELPDGLEAGELERLGPGWKAEYIDRLVDGYRAAGGDAPGADVVAAHSWARDFPVSREEIVSILRLAGFEARFESLTESSASMAPYLALVVAS